MCQNISKVTHMKRVTVKHMFFYYDVEAGTGAGDGSQAYAASHE